MKYHCDICNTDFASKGSHVSTKKHLAKKAEYDKTAGVVKPTTGYYCELCDVHSRTEAIHNRSRKHLIAAGVEVPPIKPRIFHCEICDVDSRNRSSHVKSKQHLILKHKLDNPDSDSVPSDIDYKKRGPVKRVDGDGKPIVRSIINPEVRAIRFDIPDE